MSNTPLDGAYAEVIERLMLERDEARAERDKARNKFAIANDALTWIYCNVQHATGKFGGCLAGPGLVELARGVALDQQAREEASS